MISPDIMVTYYDEQEIYAQEEKGKFYIFSIIYKCLMKRSRNTH